MHCISRFNKSAVSLRESDVEVSLQVITAGMLLMKLECNSLDFPGAAVHNVSPQTNRTPSHQTFKCGLLLADYQSSSYCLPLAYHQICSPQNAHVGVRSYGACSLVTGTPIQMSVRVSTLRFLFSAG